jgi:hypothetical protein
VKAIFSVRGRDVGSCQHTIVMICDNNLEYGWLRDRENDDNTEDTRIFRQVQVSQRIIAMCHVFLFCSW